MTGRLQECRYLYFALSMATSSGHVPLEGIVSICIACRLSVLAVLVRPCSEEVPCVCVCVYEFCDGWTKLSQPSVTTLLLLSD